MVRIAEAFGVSTDEACLYLARIWKELLRKEDEKDFIEAVRAIAKDMSKESGCEADKLVWLGYVAGRLSGMRITFENEQLIRWFFEIMRTVVWLFEDDLEVLKRAMLKLERVVDEHEKKKEMETRSMNVRGVETW